MKSRSKTAAASSSKDAASEPVLPKALPAPDACSRKAFILPKTLSEEAKIVTLAHPRTLKPTRYYHCKRTGFYEVKQFMSGPGTRRSLLLTPGETQEDTKEAAEAYVIKNAALFAVTPIDVLFLLLPALSPVPTEKKEHKSMFLTLDDYLDALDESSTHLGCVCKDSATLHLVEQRLGVVCDKVEAGDETMYRLNHEKLMKSLITKAEKMVKIGLPPSMEAHFVRKPLEVPMARLLQEEQNRTALTRVESTDEYDMSQGTTGTTTPAATDSSFSESQSTTITVPSPPPSTEITQHSSFTATESLKHSLRLRVALTFLFSSYIPPHLAAGLETLLASSSSPIDFAPLTTHLAQLGKMKAEISAQARELMNGDSRKRALEDEEASLDREEKKRKKDEEEKKKRAGESRGIRDLKKVNTTGMKKMSDFFGKKG